MHAQQLHVRRQQCAARERLQGELDACSARPSRVRPFLRRRRGEHLRAEAGGDGQRPVRFEPTQRHRVAAPEEHCHELECEELVPDVVAPGRQLGRRPTGQVGAVGGTTGEEQGPPEQLCRPRAGVRVAERLVRLAEVLGGIRSMDVQLGAPELEQDLGAQLRRRRLGECAPQVLDDTVRRAPALGGACGRHRGIDDPGVAVGGDRHQVRGDLLDRRRPVGEQAGCAPVGACALDRRNVVTDGVPHERVHELGHLLASQDLGAHQRLRGLPARAVVEIGEIGDEGEVGSRRAPRPRGPSAPRHPEAGRGARAPNAQQTAALRWRPSPRTRRRGGYPPRPAHGPVRAAGAGCRR